MRNSMGNKWLLCMSAVGALASAATTAGAQETDAPSIALERFYSSNAGDRMFSVASPYVLGHKVPHVALYFDYAHDPLILRRKDNLEYGASVVSNQLFLRANGTFTLWDRLQFNLDLPAALIQTGDEAPNKLNIVSPSGPDFGDIRLGVRVRIVGNNNSKFQLGLNGYLWFPTGTGQYVTDGWFRGLPQVVAGGRIPQRGKFPEFVYSVAAGAEIRPAINYLDGIPLGTTFVGSAGVGFVLGKEKQFQVGPEVSVMTQLREVNSQNLNIEALAGGKYRFRPTWEAGLAIGPGLSSGIGTPDVRLVAHVAYTPPWKEKDTDGDGIIDKVDACKFIKGIPHKDPKKHGCPSDRDEDYIIDIQDACPDVKGIMHPDPKKNGCPPDADEDGILDPVDACVTVKGIPHKDPKKHGCPSDRDDDGILDVVDACPDVKGVANKDPKKHGCPPDRDEDGIPDAEDACPDVPGIRTNDPKTNGCPGDNDGDGIMNDVDACPEEKGPPDPDPKQNGCPRLVRVVEGEIVILQQVQFDTGKATIRPVSFPLLDEVAAVINEHPEVVRLEVQGHTDPRGGTILNKRLSQARAESVRDALIKRNVKSERMTAKGYASERPIATNRTPEGMQKNRRVQFIILERKLKDGTTKVFENNPPVVADDFKPPAGGPRKPPTGPAKPPTGPAKPPTGPAKPPTGPAKPPGKAAPGKTPGKAPGKTPGKAPGKGPTKKPPTKKK